jgi:hypothetical protein
MESAANLFILSFILGTAAILFSILAWRLKTEVMFWLAAGFTGILLLIIAISFELMLALFSFEKTLFQGVLISSFLIIPICFIIASKLKPDKLHSDSDVTDEYLNDIINSEDEDINFE